MLHRKTVLLSAVLLVVASAVVAQPIVDNERYIVGFKTDLGPNAHAALRAAGAATALELPDHRAVAAYMRPAAAEGLARNPHVEYVEVDPKRYPLSWTNTTGLTGEMTPYGIKAVEADLLGAGPSLGSCTVCIIDSGYFANHEDLQNGNVVGAPQGSENVFEDGCGHGTHVAGTIAALGGNSTGVVGVNAGGALNLVISRVFNNTCGWAYASNLVKALDACKAKRGANKMVVSMSLGGSFKSRTEDQAFARAYNEGILSIAAAGNDGNSRTSYPAGYASVVSVAAIDANEAKASFSQYNSDVEIAAPGVSVYSTVPWIGSSITVDKKYLASHITNSGQTDGVTAPLVTGGLCDSVPSDGSWNGQTVLCQRGTVSFKAKVDNVKAGGGVAAVIYNNVSGGFAGTCDDGTGSTCVGVGIGVSKEDGEALVAQVGASGTTAASTSAKCGEALGATAGCGYEAWDGTSMATPHVSAVAALVWSHNFTKTNAQVRDALNKTAKNLGAAGRDSSFGWGLVKAARASACLAGVGPCTPSTEPMPQ